MTTPIKSLQLMEYNKVSEFQIQTTRVIIKQSGAQTSDVHKTTTECIEKHNRLTTHWSNGSTWL